MKQKCVFVHMENIETTFNYMDELFEESEQKMIELLKLIADLESKEDEIMRRK